MCATMQKLRIREMSVGTTPMVRAPERVPARPLQATGSLVSRMANIKSQIKRNRQNARRQERNKTVKSSLKTSQKKVHTAVAEGDLDTATTLQREASRSLDKAVSKGVVHKNTAARRKSRLAKTVNAGSAS